MMKRSVSLDYQSIGQSFKRVRISTSPGELRLDRDIEGLLSSREWKAQAQIANTNTNTWPHQHVNHHGASASTPSWDRRGSRIHGEILRVCPNARLLRDPVDPLRLTLCLCPHQPMSPNFNNNNAQSSSPLPPEQWTFLIKMPRMYPHVPPVITRVTRDFIPDNVPNSENMANHLWNRNIDYSASAAIVASSLMLSRVDSIPVPEHVFVRLAPAPNSDLHSDNNDHSKCLAIDLATCIHTWSPVSSLEDLLNFLIGIPARRREWWSVENNRRLHQQQHCFLRNNASNNSPVGHPTLAPHSTSFASHDHKHYQSFHETKQQHVSCDMEDDVNMNFGESMMEDTQHDVSGIFSTERHLNPFTTNRFDIGYEKSPKPYRTTTSNPISCAKSLGNRA